MKVKECQHDDQVKNVFQLSSTQHKLWVQRMETSLLDEGGQSLSNGLSELIPGGESGIMADYFVQSNL